MDWHSSVYGSRRSDSRYRSYSDDADYGTPYGAHADDDYDDYGEPLVRPSAVGNSISNYAAPLVDDAILRKRGGNGYFRAHEVIASNRMHQYAYAINGSLIILTALVTASDIYNSNDYQVTVTVDEDKGDIFASHCTCPAYGRYGSLCKHVIALIMAYDECRDEFSRVASPAEVGRTAQQRPNVRRTSRSLSAFMRQRDEKISAEAKSRQLNLLKEIGDIADAGGTSGGGQTGAVRRMPIGSVSLRLAVQFPDSAGGESGGTVKLRIQVPSRNLSYVVKDINSLLSAVHNQDFVSYGKKLAFIHTRDAFDVRSRAVLDVLDRARTIRNAINDGYDAYYYRKSDAAQMRLSDGEIADLFDAYVGSDETVDYTPSARYFAPEMRAQIVDGDPSLGLAMVRADDVGDTGDVTDHSITAIAPGGYLIRHMQCVERFVTGQHATYMICRPLSRAVLAADGLSQGEPSDSSSAADTADQQLAAVVSAQTLRAARNDDSSEDIINILRRYGQRAASAASMAPATIYRCDARFAANRDLLTLLCGDDEHASLYVSAADMDTFARTMLPLLVGGERIAEPADDSQTTESANSSRDDTANQPSGLGIELPPELLRLVRVPCRIAIYLDRDRTGITCDVQARYGDKRYHVFDGIGRTPDDLLRDKDAERLAVEAVLHYFPRPSGSVAFIPDDDDKAIYKLLTEGLPVFHGIGDVYATPAFDGLSAMPRPTVKVGLSVKSGLVEISPIADEIDPDDVPGLLAAYRKRRRFHRLRNGAFVDMRDVDTSAVDEIAADLGVKPAELEAGGIEVPAFEAYYLDHQVDDAGKDASFRAYVDDLRVIDPSRYRVPSALVDVLRSYQVEGFRWLNAVCDKGFGGILADEMGLGKTVQLLSFLLARLSESRKAVQPSLIVCPASLVYNWAAEAAKFTPDMRVETVAGSKAARRAILDEIRAAQGTAAGSVAVNASANTQPVVPDLIITSYDLLRRDIDDYAGLSFFSMALDEAQYIKNAATKASKSVRSITAAHRFALTGTPIENRLSELWSIIDFLMPGILGSYAHFRERFELPILSGDESAQAKLQAFVGPFILRRLKSQVLKDLPDKIENVITVQLSGEQRKLYAALEQQLRSVILKQKPADFNTGKIQILAQLTKLRQVCCDPRLLYENAAGTGDTGVKQSVKRSVSSAKLDAIAELVDSCRDAGRKMLIFSQFTSYLDLIAERLRANGVAYDVITGATPKQRRLELVDQFNRDETPVFLISLKAGNTGLNLTGACVVIHADPWWNAAAQNQATDRAHRIGQTQDVNVYQIVAKDTIEERILNLQRSKTDLATRFVDAASSSTGRSMAALTKDDLLALLA
ncbi:helicase [Bifidobacterium hapali]|uniref:Helicase n=1 Tax=Bifidobacterium hapali TaxID=1630172 RepID=A0A261FVS9_9BIFI|nr:DEAD/DEAH box helicase [Bifidobacterium hapali]OZG63228.1 helicase [Bifidobacterium hapali]